MGSALGPYHQHQSHQSTVSDYTINYILGKGGFATVYFGVDNRTHHEVALKIIDYQEQQQPQSQLKRINIATLELNILKVVHDHHFIVKLLSAFHDTRCCYLILTSLTGGDLRYHVKNYETFTEYRSAYIVACIASAIYHLHSHNILHRDIKPENILLDHHGVPHLTDFGTSYIIPSNTYPICRLSSGTFPYLAPEVLTPSHRHSFQSDYWSLGITAYEILFHQRPYDKHCPKDFVYFVDNYFTHYWDYIDTMIETKQYLHSDSNEMRTQIYSLPSPTYETIPHPNHYTPYSFNPHEEPVGLPSELLTTIPLRTACKDLVTAECLQFFDNILDVRIHKRLGNTYEELKNHSWFMKYYLDFETLSTLKSPFHPNVKSIQKSLILRESVNQQEHHQQLQQHQHQQQQQQQQHSQQQQSPHHPLSSNQPLISSKPMSLSPHSLARSVYSYPDSAVVPQEESSPSNTIMNEIEEKLSHFQYHPKSNLQSRSFSLSRFALTSDIISKSESH